MNASFYRKVVYGGIIALLWFPLFFIGQPPSINEQGQPTGGKLAELRTEHDLAQATLGEIDPASESMKLATLGLRGVAVNVLWGMANHYKKVEDFENMAATINQITLLAPNFVAVWKFQAHNESYNVSVEYDHYKMRYAWVKKGIDLLIRGTQYNRKDTQLLNYLAWFFGQKIGRADEHKQFRELFRDDRDYHEKLGQSMNMDDDEIKGPDRQRPDNWLVGRKWQLRAVDLVETAGVPIRGKSPVLFYSDAPMARINYSKAIEDEGILGDVAGRAWKTAYDDWVAYGRRPIPTTWGHDILLGDLETRVERLAKISDELDRLAPGVREKLIEEKRAKLRPEEREALDTPEDKRTDEQWALVYEVGDRTKVTADEVADRAPSDARRQAKLLAREFADQDEMISRIDRYRNIVNYAYWRTRSEVEQTPTALRARQAIYDADNKYKEAELEASKELYEKAWQEWAKIYQDYPGLMEDVEAETVVEAIKRYKRVLRQLEYEDLPEDFPLKGLLEAQREPTTLGGTRSSTPAPMPEPAPKPEEPPAEQPETSEPADEV